MIRCWKKEGTSIKYIRTITKHCGINPYKQKRKGKGITIIIQDDTQTVETTGIHAFGDRVRPHLIEAVFEELRIHSLYLGNGSSKYY